MSTYAIGDIQGCYDELVELLELVNFDPAQDQLWSVGDLVNRGPRSLDVLRYLMSLPKAPIVTLGNHDLHFLAVATGTIPTGPKDTLQECLSAPDLPSIIQWLRNQPLLHDAPELGYTMVHAGIPPQWDLSKAKSLAEEVSTVLKSEHYLDYFKSMYSDQPDQWDDDLQGTTRYRVITNYLTRMRFCDADGRLELRQKELAIHYDASWKPWFSWPRKTLLPRPILFGHWAALVGKTQHDDFLALDTGCVWGGSLTALRLEDRKIFSVKSHQPITRE